MPVLPKNVIRRAAFLMLVATSIALTTFSQEAARPDPTPERRTPAIELVHQGDLLEVDVLGSLEFDWRGRLTPEGYLADFDGAGEKIFALCLTTDEIARTVEKSLSKILRNPSVVVRILDTSERPAAVIYGAIATPQRFQIKRRVTLAELIIISGGLTDRLSGEIQVFRPEGRACRDKRSLTEETLTALDNRSEFLNISISELLKGVDTANIVVYSGDIITVNEAFPVFVVGGVNNPKPILFRNDLTLSRAVASAGGLSPDSRPDDVQIYRKSGNPSKLITADLEKIRAKKSDDIKLERLDVVEVGRRGGASRIAPLVDIYSETDVSDLTKLPLRVID